jgi:hypothetical protein
VLFKRSFVVLAVLALFLTAVGSLSAQNTNGRFASSRALGATINSIDRDGCVLTIVFTVDDAGSYQLTIFDDGNIEDEQVFSASTGQTITATHVIDYFVLQGAAGIGVYITTPGATSTYDFVDPYDVPSDVQQQCAEIGGTAAQPECLPLTDNAVVGRVLSTTPAYWAPGKVAPGVTINPFITPTLWVLGVDESGEFYKVLLACQYLWLPVDTMGPNPDSVWQGRLLPTTVVS